MKIESGDRKVSMEIVGDSVIISSRGANVMLFRGMQGQRSIPIHGITSVQVKLGTRFIPGYINLSYPGGKEFQGGLAAAASDPDTLIFNLRPMPKSRNLRSKSIVAEHPFKQGLRSRRPMKSQS